MSEIIFSLFVDPESLNMQLIRFNQTIAYSMILCIINTSSSSTSKHFNKDSTLYDIINTINSLIIINFISSLIIIFLFPFIWHYTARIWNSKTAYRFSQCLHPTMHFSWVHTRYNFCELISQAKRHPSQGLLLQDYLMIITTQSDFDQS